MRPPASSIWNDCRVASESSVIGALSILPCASRIRDWRGDLPAQTGPSRSQVLAMAPARLMWVATVQAWDKATALSRSERSRTRSCDMPGIERMPPLTRCGKHRAGLVWRPTAGSRGSSASDSRTVTSPCSTLSDVGQSRRRCRDGSRRSQANDASGDRAAGRRDVFSCGVGSGGGRRGFHLSGGGSGCRRFAR